MVIRLSDMEPEQLLEQLEKRSDALKEAQMLEGEAKATLEAFEAAETMRLKAGGEAGSMAEAERLMRTSDEWSGAYLGYMEAKVNAEADKRAYERARTATDLWRTERATMRAVG